MTDRTAPSALTCRHTAGAKARTLSSIAQKSVTDMPLSTTTSATAHTSAVDQPYKGHQGGAQVLRPLLWAWTVQTAPCRVGEASLDTGGRMKTPSEVSLQSQILGITCRNTGDTEVAGKRGDEWQRRASLT